MGIHKRCLNSQLTSQLSVDPLKEVDALEEELKATEEEDGIIIRSELEEEMEKAKHTKNQRVS